MFLRSLSTRGFANATESDSLSCAQSTTKQATKVPRGSVSGRVTIKEKGVPGVAIGLRKGDVFNPSEPFVRTTTDQDGFYRIGNLAPGSYSVIPSAPAFVIADIKDSGSKSVLVGEDENVEGINFALVRGGVMGARIFLRVSKPGETLSNFRPAIVDARGLFLIDGIPGGTYELSAMIMANTPGPPRTVKREVTVADGGVTEVAITIDMSAPVKP